MGSFEITLIVVLGMTFFYKILVRLIGEKSPKKGSKSNFVSTDFEDESPEDLRARAEAMQRRIATLEEIIASEHGPERRSQT